MRRRDFLVLAAWSSVGFPLRVLASGHNPYCHYRHSGGGYLSERRILVMGDDYQVHLPQLPRDKPVTVLAETPTQYSQALRDIHYSRSAIAAPYPKDSVVVMHLTAKPDLAIQRLDRTLGNVRIVHDIPGSQAQLHRIHGPGVDVSALKPLGRIEAQLKNFDAISLTESRTAANSRVQEILAQSSENDLVVVIGHRVRGVESGAWDNALPVYKIRFHDGTELAFAETVQARPTVWFLSCSSFDDVVAAAASIERPMLATTTRLTYTQASDAAVLMRKTGGSLRRIVSEIQKRPVAQSPRPTAGLPTSKGGEHPAPQKANEKFHLIVQLNDGGFASDASIEIA